MLSAAIRRAFAGIRIDAQAAHLGLASEAANGVAKRMTDWNREYAFPAMWGNGDDGLPDFDPGCVGQLALQAVLMQTEKNRILLFPAWPKDWDVSFRFPAPQNTMVGGKLINGKLQQLKVTPASRQKDVVILPVQ